MPTITVSLSDRSYDVVVENGLLSKLGEHLRELSPGEKVAVITDANVALHYAEVARRSLAEAGFTFSMHLVPPGETSKSMDQVDHLCRSLIEHHHDRQSIIVALGGGVVGDLAGFVAAIFYRGIPFVQVPTTIVSQVDSAVGGKTGVNTPEGKNLIGVFHQPLRVLADPESLLHLPSRVFREGFAEVIKHAAIRDAAMLDDLEELDLSGQHTSADLLARNVAIKARIVEEDERETSGTRALLNFGHTVGHAIEASVPYGTLLHGEAISLGMRAALHLSEQFAGLANSEATRLIALMARFELPLVLPEDITTKDILSHMTRDKKFFGGKRRFVLLPKLGEAVISDDVPEGAIEEAVELLRVEHPAARVPATA